MADSLPKPRLISFMWAGFDLTDALSILNEWDNMTDGERAALTARIQGLRNVLQVASNVRVWPFPNSTPRAIRSKFWSMRSR